MGCASSVCYSGRLDSLQTYFALLCLKERKTVLLTTVSLFHPKHTAGGHTSLKSLRTCASILEFYLDVMCHMDDCIQTAGSKGLTGLQHILFKTGSLNGTINFSETGVI